MYAARYIEELTRVMGQINITEVVSAVKCLGHTISAGKAIYVVGNGGSSAMADHFVIDLMKMGGTNRVYSLTANTAVLTAMANDISYEDALAAQLPTDKDDFYMLVAISSSGKSPNIINAARGTQARRWPVVAISGKRDGEFNPLLDMDLLTCVPIAIPSGDTQIIEDCTSAILHCMARMLREARQ